MTPIRLRSNSYKDIVQNKDLLEIINEIISSYPVTYVNLERIRAKVDKIDEMFWIKDEDNKYLFTNKKFAVSLGVSPSQIEGKPVESFIPAYLISFNRALDSYIKESKNTFIIEGFPVAGLPVGEYYQTIEIPITGSEGNVAAIICIAQKAEIKVKETADKNFIQSSLNLVKLLYRSFVYIDENGIIKELSDEFCVRYSLNKSMAGNSYKKILPSSILLPIQEFFTSAKVSDRIEIRDKQDNKLIERVYLIKAGEPEAKGVIVAVDDRTYEGLSEIVNNDSKIPDILIHNNPEPVFIYDKENLRFLSVNKAALSLYGYSKDEFLQLDLTDLYAPEDIQLLLNSSDDKFKEGSFSIPFCHKKKDGSSVFVEISRSGIIYKEREAFFNIIRNVTEKLNLAKESQQFKAAFENTDDLLFITDKDGFIKSVNRSVIQELGYSAKNLEESSFTSLVADDDRSKINTAIFHKGAREKIFHKTHLKKAGNEQVNVELVFVPIFDFRGEIDSYNIIAKTGRVKIKETDQEIQVKSITEKSDEATTHDTDFLSGVFHEMLTPINVILGFVHELIESIDNPLPEQKEAIAIINQNRTNLLELMNNVIEFSRILKNKIDIEPEAIKITEIIEEVSKEIKNNRTFEIGFGKISSSLEVVTDKQKFRLLINLLMKITSSGKKVYLSASTLDGDFIINFRDSYSNISEELLNKLNDIFRQPASAEKGVDEKEILLSSKYGLAPLDVHLSKSLLEVLGGKFTIIKKNNKKDAGFVFPIRIKQRGFVDEQVSAEESRLKETIPGEIESVDKEFFKEEIGKEEKIFGYQQSLIDLSQLSCLYIEDQTDSQTLFSALMKELKEIKFANDFMQAFPLLQEKQFDFVVVDINLPGDYNGLDILKILRRMPGYENIPVIAVSAYLLPGDRERFIHAGFSDFISKPVFREKLLSSLEKLFMPQA